MMARHSALFSDKLAERYKASMNASPQEKATAVRDVMRRAGLRDGREGTSGAANAYALFLGEEFGMESSPECPKYSPDTMGSKAWASLWRLRVGEWNPHFAPEWSKFRKCTRLWNTMYSWLPHMFDTPGLAYTMFGWANLAMKPATPASLTDGMWRYIAPLIEANKARVVVVTNRKVAGPFDGWASKVGGTRTDIDDFQAWRITLNGRHVFAAKLGHPSRLGPGTKRDDYFRRFRRLIAEAEQLQ